MTILITGGTGKTGSVLAQLLHNAKVPTLVSSRAGKAPKHLKAVQFNWLDPTTFNNPFQADPNIDEIYIVGPDNIFDSSPRVRPFLELAVPKGVKRFVAVTSTRDQPAVWPSGVVQQTLPDLNVEFTVLQPTWFIDDFATVFRTGIIENNEITTCAGGGFLLFLLKISQKPLSKL